MSDEANSQSDWTWAEGAVDPGQEHIEIRYGDASSAAYDQWIRVALVGPPVVRTFPVRWLSVSLSPEILAAVRHELDFYLIEHPASFPDTGDPWRYVVYHCATAANVYSKVHWSYFEFGQQGSRHASQMLQIAADETRQLFERPPMTGAELLATLRPGEYLRLAHGHRRVHRAYLDQRTGDMRICRPSMLDAARRSMREWVKADSAEYSANPCDTCK